MPRRTYDPRRGRRRQAEYQGPSVARLATELAPVRVAVEPHERRPCIVCQRPLSPTWRYPEHAGCLPANRKVNP